MLKGTLKFIIATTVGLSIATASSAATANQKKPHRGAANGHATAAATAVTAAQNHLTTYRTDEQQAMSAEHARNFFGSGGYFQEQEQALNDLASSISALSTAATAQDEFDADIAGSTGSTDAGLIGNLWQEADSLQNDITHNSQVIDIDHDNFTSYKHEVNTINDSQHDAIRTLQAQQKQDVTQSQLDGAVDAATDRWSASNNLVTQSQLTAAEKNDVTIGEFSDKLSSISDSLNTAISGNTRLINADAKQLDSEIASNDLAIANNDMAVAANSDAIAGNTTLIDTDNQNLQGEIDHNTDGIYENAWRTETNHEGVLSLDKHVAAVEASARGILNSAEIANLDDSGLKKESEKALKAALAKMAKAREILKNSKDEKAQAQAKAHLQEAQQSIKHISAKFVALQKQNKDRYDQLKRQLTQQKKAAKKAPKPALTTSQRNRLLHANARTMEYAQHVETMKHKGGHDARGMAEVMSLHHQGKQFIKTNKEAYQRMLNSNKK